LRSVECLLALSLAGAAWSAPKRAPRAAPETVYVQVTPPRESRPAPAPERDYAPEPRRQESSLSVGPARNFAQAYGMNLGFYSAEVLGGTTPYANFFGDIYPEGQAFFFDFAAGIGKAQSGLAENVIGGSRFENGLLITGEALVGYSLTGLSRGEGRGGGLFPYLVGGITTVYQGGSPNIGGVLGFGNRTDLPWVRDTRWAINYGMRDHLYAQKNNTYQALTQNFVLLIGVQKYY
jgi:hypothetical protein